jgi:hypothetical protein
MSFNVIYIFASISMAQWTSFPASSKGCAGQTFLHIPIMAQLTVLWHLASQHSLIGLQQGIGTPSLKLLLLRSCVKPSKTIPCF